MGFSFMFRGGSDHQHCPLLRSRRERPRDCHAIATPPSSVINSRRPMKKVI